jgi:hypothetical protein
MKGMELTVSGICGSGVHTVHDGVDVQQSVENFRLMVLLGRLDPRRISLRTAQAWPYREMADSIREQH